MKGKRVATLNGLMWLSWRRRAVVYQGRRMPAAFVASMQARVVAQMIAIGLYEYRRAK